MNWKAIFSSSLGKKLIMGASGIFLILFLVVHCFINSLIFFDDTGNLFTQYASFMSNNIIIRIMEIGLLLGFIVHIIDGFALWISNSKKRPVKYKVKPGNATSKWYSRYMGVLGSLILLFLITHMSQFWLPNRTGQYAEESEMFQAMIQTFANPTMVIVYVLGCISLCYHLLHGFESAFQTLGWNYAKYKSLIHKTGVAFAIIVPAIFAAMPIWMHFHFAS